MFVFNLCIPSFRNTPTLNLQSGQKFFALLFLFFCCLTLSAQSETATSTKSLDSLAGTWSIDLRPTPDSEPYLKQFVLTLKDATSFNGEFYDSPVYNGLLNKNWEKVYFAFFTRDQSNEYYHSGYWLNGKMYGTTYCPTRNFVAPWIGTRKE